MTTASFWWRLTKPGVVGALTSAGELAPASTMRPARVSVHLSALETMRREAIRYAPLETGGVLVGRLEEYSVYGLLASGQAADRSAGHWIVDAEALQPQLDRAAADGLRFVGFWHVHPGELRRLSGGDLLTARRVLRDPDYDVDWLLLPVSVVDGATVSTRFYFVDRDGCCELPVELRDDRGSDGELTNPGVGAR